MPFDHAQITARIREMGPGMGPETMGPSGALFRDHQEREPYRDVEVVRDIAYGPDPRNLLDIFKPAGGGHRLPVLVFVHGGGFVQGERRMPGTPYNDNVALFAVRHGMIGVNMTYRLAPAHQWPSGPEDMAAAVQWLRREIADHGGDPERIFLMGTSAGAVHVASYIAHPEFHAADGIGIAGGLLLSGRYSFAATDAEPRLAMYFGDDPALYPSRSSTEGLVATTLPVLYVVAEFDPPPFLAQAVEILELSLKQRGRLPPFIHLLGHNHFTASLHLNTEDESLGRQIVAFVEDRR